MEYRPRLTEDEYNLIQNHRSDTKKQVSLAKILVFDIETAPIKAYVWSMWKQNIGTHQFIEDWFMLTWSAKWLFSDEVLSDKLTPDEALMEDDKRITKSIWNLIDEADLVIAHNGNKFDIPKLNTRFLIHGLNNPRPYQAIDTLAHARRHLRVTSNRLDYLGEYLGLGRKKDTGGFKLWAGCMNGDQESLTNMQLYCDQDVLLLEAVYLKLRPFIKPHPNVGLLIGDNLERCPTCASVDLEPYGEYVTYTNIYEACRCKSCGATSRSRKSITPKRDFSNLKTSLPK